MKIDTNTQITNTRITHKGYHIDISLLTKEQISEIENDLTVVPHILDATKEELEKAKFKVFKYSDDRLELIVPRYYGIARFGDAVKEFDSEEIDTVFTKELRPIQTTVSDQCISYMKKNGGGLLSVPCGFGKTVCAVYIAQKLGLKTLIVVHKSFLIEQWIDAISNFLDMDLSKVGVIRQKICHIDNKDIVIGMIQTISRRSQNKDYVDMFKGFGLVIYDEAHHVSCKFFSKSLMTTNAQYTLALTATPYRGDNTIKVMYWFLGNTMYRERFKINKNMIVKIIHYKSKDKLFSHKKRWRKGQFKTDVVKMTSNICNIKSRNKAIINCITSLRRLDPERKILILSGRKEHLKVLKTGVDKDIDEDIKKGLIDEDEIFSCYYIGTTKPSIRQQIRESGDIVFATTEMANEGLDIKHLNTIILASPKKDVMQSVGRILRTILKSGDVKPMVIDFADDIEVIGKWLNIRTTIYKNCKYEMENFYLIDEEFKTSTEYKGIDEDNETHHENPFIHNAINTHNKTLNNLKRDIERVNKMLNKTEYEYLQMTEDLPVLDDMELTDINDILRVPRLTISDFEIIDSKTETECDDMCVDDYESYNNKQEFKERTVQQAVKNKLNKRLF